MNIATIGIDLAKNVFQLHAVDECGKVVLQKRLPRTRFLEFFANIPKCVVGLESCGGANHWARKLRALGYDVRLMSPQYVKPYVKTNKNDYNDAEAVCEAVTRPNMRFVPIKTVEQQDIQSLHRMRERLIRDRTALVNQVRGLLREYGVVIPLGIAAFRSRIASILEDADNELTALTRELAADQYQRLIELDERIKKYEKRIEQVFRDSELCQRLAQVEGVGVLTATALIAAVGDARVFKNGRQMAAWLGLVPRQNSSGERKRLLGISKRGNTYLRTLLIHGGRSAILRCKNKTDRRSRWLAEVKSRRGINRACVALANKNARTLWALMATDAEFVKVA